MDAFTENASVNDIFDRFPSPARAVCLYRPVGIDTRVRYARYRLNKLCL